MVVLTTKGDKTRQALLDEFHRPPPEFAALDRGDLEALALLLAKLTPTSSQPVRKHGH
jgi:hypothetical protein